ncbi:MAG: 30S ribosomal protein S16 [Candidatus Magasanikbacteria bacterium]|nr:30S ribosomal protein S16 [Candidatus Magasanikbacteria bacterium]
MLTIRLQRVGKKGKPTYKLVISEKARDTHDVYLEQLGTYNPHVKEDKFKPTVDRIKYWLSKGAQMSPTIENLLISNKVIEGKKKKSVFLSKKRKTKVGDKKAASEKAAAEKKAAEATAKVAAEEKAAAEAVAAAPAPVESIPAEAAPAPETPVA